MEAGNVICGGGGDFHVNAATDTVKKCIRLWGWHFLSAFDRVRAFELA